MFEHMLFVFRPHIDLVDGFLSLGVDPTNIDFASALQATVKVFDQTHNESEFEQAFVSQRASSFHLPASSRVTPRSNF